MTGEMARKADGGMTQTLPDGTTQTMGAGGMTQRSGGVAQGLAQTMQRPTRKFTMLSRTADSLFWMARYMERAEFLARGASARTSDRIIARIESESILLQTWVDRDARAAAR